ncbi:hypothetical protein LSAT2_020177 [Lamellibrachia satsuma]|nr:hypothetical protein LSAT2_020177 [Lamellibrachia satsuma]
MGVGRGSSGGSEQKEGRQVQKRRGCDAERSISKNPFSSRDTKQIKFTRAQRSRRQTSADIVSDVVPYINVFLGLNARYQLCGSPLNLFQLLDILSKVEGLQPCMQYSSLRGR